MLEKMQRFQMGETQAFAHGRGFSYGALQALAAHVTPDTDWRALAASEMQKRAASFGNL
jgi:hypothetical protein